MCAGLGSCVAVSDGYPYDLGRMVYLPVHDRCRADVGRATALAFRYNGFVRMSKRINWCTGIQLIVAYRIIRSGIGADFACD